MNPPLVFISYSHDSADHKAWVLRLASDLRENGVDAILDQWDLVPGQDASVFMQQGILRADRVLMVCSKNYVSKAEVRSGGVGFEQLIVTSEVVQAIDTKKFIPLVRNNLAEPFVPRFLGPRIYINFNDDVTYEARREDLLRELLAAPIAVKPPIGLNPFSATMPKQEEPARTTSPTGITRNGGSVLSDPWFEAGASVAKSGIEKLGLKGCMELRFALHDEITKSQLELLSAVRKSQVHTFGWPIGVTLENRDEYKPRPFGDGIRAEIAIANDSLSGRQSYDYWAVRRNGDFYLLQSLFEDSRSENSIFFNTRIVRVAESLMFAANFYTNLSVPPESKISLRVSHDGLTNRTLTSASPNRSIFPRVSHEAKTESEIVVMLGNMHETLVDNVRKIVEPMFMLFEFAEFDDAVYTDIVQRFVNGQSS